MAGQPCDAAYNDRWDILSLDGCSEIERGVTIALHLSIPWAALVDFDALIPREEGLNEHQKRVRVSSVPQGPLLQKLQDGETTVMKLFKAAGNIGKEALRSLDDIVAGYTAAHGCLHEEALWELQRVCQQYGVFVWDSDIEGAIFGHGCDSFAAEVDRTMPEKVREFAKSELGIAAVGDSALDTMDWFRGTSAFESVTSVLTTRTGTSDTGRAEFYEFELFPERYTTSTSSDLQLLGSRLRFQTRATGPVLEAYKYTRSLVALTDDMLLSPGQTVRYPTHPRMDVHQIVQKLVTNVNMIQRWLQNETLRSDSNISTKGENRALAWLNVATKLHGGYWKHVDWPLLNTLVRVRSRKPSSQTPKTTRTLYHLWQWLLRQQHVHAARRTATRSQNEMHV